MKVSVIIPVYNTALYLEQCLESIVNNNFQDMEILCINDGSTDNALVILQEFAKKDSRIKIINNVDNMGVAYSKQLALNVACGAYIMYLDSDDFVTADFVAEAYRAIVKDKLDIVFFECGIIPQGARANILYQNFLYPALKTSHKEKSILHLYAYDPTKIISRQFLIDNQLKYLEVRAFEDIYFNTCLLVCAGAVRFIPKVLYYYRIRKHSITNSVSMEVVLDLVKVFAELKQYLENKNCWKYYHDIVLLNKYKKIYSYYHRVDSTQIVKTDKARKALRETSTFEELLSIKPILKGKIFFFMKRILKPEVVDFVSINYIKYVFHQTKLWLQA